MKGFETHSELGPHPHAESMALYARDAMETEEPWLRWQLQTLTGLWVDCTAHPAWHQRLKYRRKPVARTHMVNGFEVPAPPAAPPRVGESYYAVAPDAPLFFRIHSWTGGPCCLRLWERGLVFMTEGDAPANSKAMCGIDPYAVENPNEGL